jgi:hypothetical protein
MIEVQQDLRRNYPGHPDLVAMRSNHGTALLGQKAERYAYRGQVSQAALHPPRVTPEASGHGSASLWARFVRSPGCGVRRLGMRRP